MHPQYRMGRASSMPHGQPNAVAIYGRKTAREIRGRAKYGPPAHLHRGIDLVAPEAHHGRVLEGKRAEAERDT